IFVESGSRARAATWRLDVRRARGKDLNAEWAIVDGERVSSVESLYRLSLNTTKQYTTRDLRISAEDLDLTLTEGSIFVSDIDQGVTALVLLGRGTMSFHPDPPTEKGQVKIFAGSETLESSFDAVFIRINPIDFEQLIPAERLQARGPGAIDPRELKRALEIFRDESGRAFGIH